VVLVDTCNPLEGLGLGVGSPASPTPHGPRSSPTPRGSHLSLYVTAERIIQETTTR